ncbi:MAG: hypothetical protein OHK0019_34790 [Saprospiraceae bacterium]
MRLNPIFKSLFLVLLFVLACFTVQSCLKESVPNGKETYEKENTVAYREGLNCPQIKSSVYQSEGKLVFSDYQHFYDCIECLEQDVEVYNDAYENQYPTATAEELDILDSINNFKEWQPLADFETSKSFTSLRSIVEQQSQVWLNAQYGETINFDNDPDELCPIIDEETRTLFNVDGYIKIGNEVVSMQDWADEAETALWDCCAFYRSSKYTFDYADDPYLLNRQIRAKTHYWTFLQNA